MNLDFDDSIRMHPGTRKQERDKFRRLFINRVDRKLSCLKDSPLNRFSIKCRNDIHPSHIIGWINNVLNLHQVSELSLRISSYWDWPLSSQIIVSETMVKRVLGVLLCV
ncbi:unnamed protein product [Cochlearia groenlandica]